MGSLAAQQLQFQQTRRPIRTDAGVVSDIFPGTVISILMSDVCGRAHGMGKMHVEKVEPGAVHVDQKII
jgi:hypothetical protein